jgi:protein required for attachment to host cells
MSTGQGATWVLVTDAQHARVLEVLDAGLVPRLRTSLKAEPPPGEHHPPQHGWTHGSNPHPLEEEKRFAHQLVHALERGLADNQLQHLVLVAPPRMLGLLRDALSRGVADRLRASIAKDWDHVTDHELPEHVRPLVRIWPRRP